VIINDCIPIADHLKKSVKENKNLFNFTLAI
jgi:hypothetical protein